MLRMTACFFMGASVTQRQMTQRKDFVLDYIFSSSVIASNDQKPHISLSLGPNLNSTLLVIDSFYAREPARCAIYGSEFVL